MHRMLLLMCALAVPSMALAEPINAIVGDASFFARHGHLPTAEEDAREVDRIRTHLTWVEEVLRARDVSHLSADERASRSRLLDVLHEYTARGVFPHNERFVGRRPRFIDDDGNICAVGRLIEASAGRPLAQAIDDRHEYDYLLDMHDARLEQWIASSGFTAIELAMIQPSYEWMRPHPIERPEPDPWTQDELTARVAVSGDAVSTCSDDEVRSVRVMVTAGGIGGLRVLARSRPRRAELERCVQGVVHQSIVMVGRAMPGTRMTTVHTFPIEQVNATAAAVRSQLNDAMGELQSCMPAPDPGLEQHATLRISVAADGSMRLVGARIPSRRGGTSREDVLGCLELVISTRSITAPARPQMVSPRIVWGGTLDT